MTARNGSGRTGLGSRFFFGALVVAIGILIVCVLASIPVHQLIYKPNKRIHLLK